MRDLQREAVSSIPSVITPASEQTVSPPAPQSDLGAVKLAKEVMKHDSKLSKAAVTDVKERHGMPRCVTDPSQNELIAQHKDPRSLFIDIMKVIKLDEGISSFEPAISTRISSEVRDVFKTSGYNLPDDLLKTLVEKLTRTELEKYMERMYVIRKYVALRLNVILVRFWELAHGKATHPDSLLIRPKKNGGDDDSEDNP